jgi:hypothetical protein
MPMSGLDSLDSLTYVFGLAFPRYSTHCIHVLVGFVISGYPIGSLEGTGYNIPGGIFGYLHDQII